MGLDLGGGGGSGTAAAGSSSGAKMAQKDEESSRRGQYSASCNSEDTNDQAFHFLLRHSRSRAVMICFGCYVCTGNVLTM